MTRRPMTAAEKRELRVWTPATLALITAGIILAAAIEGAPA